MIAKLKSY